MLYETAARAQEVLSLDVTDLDLPERRALTQRKGGHTDALVWGTATATLLPRYLRGRTSGPLFLSTQGPGSMRPAARHDTDQNSGLRRLSYRRAAELFSEHSGGLTLHQLRHSAIVDLLEAGYGTALVRAKSGHRSLRSFEVYAKPTTRAVADMTADLERSRRG
jgi:integrase/recombinase XerC/integrase/recombinase XerD